MAKEYTYYTPVYSTKHGLYISEIAAIWSEQTGWKTLANKLPIKVLSEFARAYECAAKRPHLYYETRNGLRRVYLNPEEILNSLNKEVVVNKDAHYAYVMVGNKKYTLYREVIPS